MVILMNKNDYFTFTATKTINADFSAIVDKTIVYKLQPLHGKDV